MEREQHKASAEGVGGGTAENKERPNWKHNHLLRRFRSSIKVLPFCAVGTLETEVVPLTPFPFVFTLMLSCEFWLLEQEP